MGQKSYFKQKDLSRVPMFVSHNGTLIITQIYTNNYNGRLEKTLSYWIVVRALHGIWCLYEKAWGSITLKGICKENHHHTRRFFMHRWNFTCFRMVISPFNLSMASTILSLKSFEMSKLLWICINLHFRKFWIVRVRHIFKTKKGGRGRKNSLTFISTKTWKRMEE